MSVAVELAEIGVERITWSNTLDFCLNSNGLAIVAALVFGTDDSFNGMAIIGLGELQTTLGFDMTGGHRDIVAIPSDE